MNKLTFGSLFAGIGGFDLGFSSMKCVFQVELDAKCNAVRRRHWGDVPQFDDVRTFNVSEVSVRPDIICGGFPCQDLSVAGRRAGLAGERSGLFYEFMRVVDEFRPGWVCIENVPGLYSSWSGDTPSSLGLKPGPGREVVLEETSDLDIVTKRLGELGYRWTLRCFDAQYFGLAQRRKRVFVVANLGDGPHPAEILFDSESLSRNPPKGRKAGARVADCLTSGVAGGSGVNRPGRRREDDSNIVTAATLNSGGNNGGFRTEPGEHLVSFCLNGKNGNRLDGESETFVTHTLRAEGHDASEDGTGRGVPLVSGTIAASGAGTERPAGQGNELDFCVAFAQNQRGELRESEIAPQLTCGGGKPGEGFPAARTEMGVRRLTPRECERLQGFPDDFTRWDDQGNEIADSPRYRMLGNAVAVPVAEWIGRRIIAAVQK